MPASGDRDLCGNCRYSFKGVDINRDSKCPECGEPARVLINPHIGYPEIPAIAFVMNAVMIAGSIAALMLGGTSTLRWSWFPLLMAGVSIRVIMKLNHTNQSPSTKKRLQALTAVPGLIVLLILFLLMVALPWF